MTKLLEWGAVKQFQLAARIFSVVLALLSREFVQPLPIKNPVAERLRVKRLDEEDNAVCSPAASVDVGLFLEQH